MLSILLGSGVINMSRTSTPIPLLHQFLLFIAFLKSLDRTRETDFRIDSTDKPPMPYFRIPS